MLDTEDTIVAIASAAGSGLRGVVRISGPATVELLSTCFDDIGVGEDGVGEDGVDPAGDELRRKSTMQHLRHPTMIAGNIKLPEDARNVPGRLYVWPTKRSYTGQPSAEFHTFGAAPLLQAVVRELRRRGARLAEPGEFTMRAFLAGRIDLTQAEAVLGVIDAESSSQAEAALKQLAGGLAQPLHAMRDRMLNLLADIEAGLDFVEEDIEFVESQQIESELVDFLAETESLLAKVSRRELPQHEFRVVFRGLPNVGKSSLMNAILRESASLVADQAGTTRDYVERRCEILGLRCLLTDTAGYDSTSRDAIEQASQQQAEQQLAAAHLELLCLDAARSLQDWERDQLGQKHPKRVVVWTKSDRAAAGEKNSSEHQGVRTSALRGEGIEELCELIARRLWSEQGEAASVVATTATRCVVSLESARESLQQALNICRHGQGDEVLAFELRQALHELGVVAGVVYTDDVLDRVFSRFCIGK